MQLALDRGPERSDSPPMVIRILGFLALMASLAGAENTTLDRWLARQETIRAMEVSFTQTRTLPALKKPVVTPGRLVFQKPGKLRWELGDPPATIAVSDGETVTLVDRKDGSARQIPADSPKATRFSLLAGRALRTADGFKETFEVAAHRVDKGIEQFTLRPLDRSLRNQVPWVFLSIDPKSERLVALELELKDKSRIRSVFGKPEINRNPDPALFTVDLSGLKVR